MTRPTPWKSLCLLLTLLCAAPALAGLRYEFILEGSDPRVRQEGEVWMEGDRARVEYRGKEAPFVYDAALRDGASETFLHTVDRTWHNTEMIEEATGRTILEAATVDELAPVMIAPDATVEVKKVKVEQVGEEPGEEMAGLPTTRHVVEVSYVARQNVYGTVLPNKIRATVEVWTTDAFEGVPAAKNPVHVVTGLPEVDEALSAELAKIPGFPVRRVVTAVREVPDTPPAEGSASLTLTGIREEVVDESRFAVPEDYRRQAPQRSGPVARDKTSF